MKDTVFSSKNKCFTYVSSDSFPTVEDWLESFPHLFFTFEPSAVVALHPRDLFFKENDQHCFGLDYISSRIILGGMFFRNLDVLFDRNASTISIVRSECSTEPGFNFTRYYKDHRDAFLTKPRGKNDQSAFNKFLKYTVYSIAIGLCLWLVIWRLIVKRFKNRSDSQMKKVEAEIDKLSIGRPQEDKSVPEDSTEL